MFSHPKVATLKVNSHMGAGDDRKVCTEYRPGTGVVPCIGAARMNTLAALLVLVFPAPRVTSGPASPSTANRSCEVERRQSGGEIPLFCFAASLTLNQHYARSEGGYIGKGALSLDVITSQAEEWNTVVGFSGAMSMNFIEIINLKYFSFLSKPTKRLSSIWECNWRGFDSP
ncbi:hypothetical protein MKZ38_002920 [Zalerion maritima]|uniref:Uncharacterized protein n=1 Tax=Zalerion maritima TaxID=339359 RepID=A0AAD5WQY0_9PEZI|nr:hypothetical protein MKZ38_002920 [Zalerion maritima]